MLINVKVVPNARQEKAVQEEGRLKVHLCAPAVDGKANARLVEFLAARFAVKKRDVVIVRGETSRQKLIEIKGK
jgi:uncharacterized protein